MATVSSYLVVIASGVVRDVYLRFVRPQAGQTEIRRVSQGVMIFFGLVVVALNIYPVQYLQALVVFSTSTIAATLLVPAVMAAYRPRDGAGHDCRDAVGFGTMLALFQHGWIMAFNGYDQGLGPEDGIPRVLPCWPGTDRVGPAGIGRGWRRRKPLTPSAWMSRLVAWLFDRQDDQLPHVG